MVWKQNPLSALQASFPISRVAKLIIAEVYPSIFIEALERNTMNGFKRLALLLFLFFALPLFPHKTHAHERERLSVHKINLNPAHEKLGPDGLAGRVDTVAKVLLDDLKSGTRSWDLIGLSQAYCEPQGIFNTCTETPHRCLSHGLDESGSTLGKQLTTHCLAGSLQGKTGRMGTPKADIIRQKGTVGFVVRQEKFEILDGVVNNKVLGGTWFKASGKRVLGARLRIKSTGHILPFYTADVGPGVSRETGMAASNQTKQIQDLISAVKTWWRSGDLTPLVVGTFNLTGGNKCYDLMSEDFDEVGRDLGVNGMEQIWIGKENSFQGSRGRMEVVRYETLESLREDSSTLPDHSVSYAELLTPGPDVRDLTVRKSKFTNRFALEYDGKVRCDRYELTFSWNCNYLPRFTIMVDGFAYQDPRNNIRYAHRICPSSAGTMTVPLYFVVVPGSYARVVTVELDTPECSKSIDIKLESPSIKITPYLHKGYEYTALGSPNREQFIRGATEAYQDVQVMDDILIPAEIEEYWSRRIFVHGKPIGEPHNPRSLIAGFVIRYKPGFVAKPVFCTIQSNAVIDPISLSARVTKSRASVVVERSTIDNLSRKHCTIFDGFTRQDYLDSASLTFDFEAADAVGQRPHNRQTFYAKSLLCIISPEYSELLVDLDSGSIKARIYDSVIKALFTDLMTHLPEHDRPPAQQGFTAFRLKIADEVRDTLARIQNDKNLWSAIRKAQREHYVDTEQEIFRQFVSQASFAEAQGVIEPLREHIIETALSTPIEILSQRALSDLGKSETVRHIMRNLLFKESNQTAWPP
jgi:hypothetical protein